MQDILKEFSLCIFLRILIIHYYSSCIINCHSSCDNTLAALKVNAPNFVTKERDQVENFMMMILKEMKMQVFIINSVLLCKDSVKIGVMIVSLN